MSESEDEFGDFDDFDEFEVAPGAPAAAPDTVPGAGGAGGAGAAGAAPGATVLAFDGTVKAQTAALLKASGAAPVVPSEDRFTRTAVELWHQLMEDPSAAFLQWEGSSLHRKLVQSFGVPLNLDRALPKVKTREMALETTPSAIAEWTLLSIVSKEALEGMDEAEELAYRAQLEGAIRAAKQLLESLECQEMDLKGEKDVLEGMVDSLLAYTQKSQREGIKKRRA